MPQTPRRLWLRARPSHALETLARPRNLRFCVGVLSFAVANVEVLCKTPRWLATTVTRGRSVAPERAWVGARGVVLGLTSVGMRGVVLEQTSVGTGAALESPGVGAYCSAHGVPISAGDLQRSVTAMRRWTRRAPAPGRAQGPCSLLPGQGHSLLCQPHWGAGAQLTPIAARRELMLAPPHGLARLTPRLARRRE